MNFGFRKCEYSDLEYILLLKELCMKWYIEIIYGWDIDVQREFTKKELDEHINDTRIITYNNKDIGVTTFYEEDGEYIVGLIIVHPDYQGKAIGTKILKDYINKAKENNKTIRLKTYKLNPAKRLYERLGFIQYMEDDTHVYLRILKDINTPEELLDFMSNNINYGYLGKNGRVYHYDDKDFDSSWYREYILENSDDLFTNLYGNCWDQVEFERDWFLKNGYEVKTIYEMVHLDYDNNYPSHSFLVFKDNDYWYWFENSDFNNRGIHKYNSFEELINDEYNRYINYLKTFNITDLELEKIIVREFDKPKEHISASEYLDFVINSKGVNPNE